MSLVQTITTTQASVSTSSTMTSQPPASANTAASSSQSFLLAPLQTSSSSNVPITPGKAKKQAQAQRTRLMTLSKHLMTRLQYANFKVEHGWSKQSLSEVENLYYRQNQSSTRNAGPTANAISAATRTSASTSPNNASSKAPVTPGVAATHAQVGVGSRLFKDAAVKRMDVEGGDVFGGYGLATPPASAGSIPGASSYLTSKRGRSTSSTPISPPNTSTNSSATKAADAASALKRSPNSTNNTSNASRALHGASSTAGAGGATSYADFWSRVGSSAGASSVAANAASRSISPSKKRSADDVAADPTGTSKGLDGVASTMASATSPHKRVRMEPNADRSTTTSASNSPAKAALSERGPSFASSARRH